MYSRLTFIDLETTGLSEHQDRIIEFGAVRVENGRVTDRFSSLANPGRRIPLTITRLTGITSNQVQAAEPVEQVLTAFLTFLGDDPLVAHNARFEAGFLTAATEGRFRPTLLDSLELARIVLPTARSHRLEAMVRHYGLGDRVPHRAAEDAELTARVWRALVDELYAKPFAVLSELNFVVGSSSYPLRRLLQDAESRAMVRGFGAKEPKLMDLMEDHRRLVTYRPPEPDPDRPRADPVSPEASVKALEAGGAISAILPGYEQRPQQIAMARAVAEALAGDRHLLVEAGTGVGKSLAYLIPAVLHSVQTGETVVVSTHTKNLQAQLFYKDLPLVAKALGVEFKAALIKGRTNYLCLRKLRYLLQECRRELDDRERIGLLPTITWAAVTRTGDMAENTALYQNAPPGLAERLVTTGEECLGRASPTYHQCFPRMNRGKALQANIVVANHALVFSELGDESVVLPPHSVLILDEAHNIEDIATEHLAVRFYRFRLYRVLSRLFRAARRGAGGTGTGTGLLASVHHQLSVAAGDLDAERVSSARLRTTRAIEATASIVPALDDFFAALGALCAGGREERVRIRAEDRPPQPWKLIEAAQKELIAACAGLAGRIEELAEDLKLLRGQGLPYAREFLKELEAQVQYLREIMRDIDFLLRADEDAYVYWLEVQDAQENRYELAAAPLDVSQLLVDQVYSKKRSVILTSATLTVDGSFEFLKKRLGLDKVAAETLSETAVGTPFDFGAQCLLVVPDFLPEPASREFPQALARMLVPLFIATRGRGLALFTSYDMLGRVYDHVKPRLEAEDIPVLGQGRDGSREGLLETFSRETASVLLGTASFWEGVDVRGEALSALVLAKMPFQVFTDPIVKGRCERIEAEGKDAFWNYSLPTAVLKFRQGFGRLIRSKTDRGVVVVCDKRLLRRRYGRVFLRSVPPRYQVARALPALLRMVEQFLAGSDTARSEVQGSQRAGP